MAYARGVHELIKYTCPNCEYIIMEYFVYILQCPGCLAEITDVIFRKEEVENGLCSCDR